jgi:hypothetical protein
MNDELGKDLEVCSAGIIEVPSLHFPESTKENHGTP